MVVWLISQTFRLMATSRTGRGAAQPRILPAGGVRDFLGQYAPEERMTAVTVRMRITKSKVRDQFST
jgi:hypothetical protein